MDILHYTSSTGEKPSDLFINFCTLSKQEKVGKISGIMSTKLATGPLYHECHLKKWKCHLTSEMPLYPQKALVPMKYPINAALWNTSSYITQMPLASSLACPDILSRDALPGTHTADIVLQWPLAYPWWCSFGGLLILIDDPLQLLPHPARLALGIHGHTVVQPWTAPVLGLVQVTRRCDEERKAEGKRDGEGVCSGWTEH